MSDKGNKEKKVTPSIKDSLKDITTLTDLEESSQADLQKSSQADLEESSPSGSPCICKGKRNIMCTLHGG